MSTPSPKTRLIPARFPGRCRNCGKTVASGEMIWFAKGYGVRCEACGQHPDCEQPLPSKQKSSLTSEQIGYIKARIAGGERITRIAKEFEIPWQRLWSILNSSTAAPAAPAPEVSPATPAGKHAASRCHDGVWRYEINSVTEAVADTFEDYAQNDANRQMVAEQLSYKLSGRNDWANYYTKEKFVHDLPTRRSTASAL